MNTWLQNRLLRHGLFWAAASGFNFVMQLPAHFFGGVKLYVWGLIFNQLPASMLATYTLLYWILPRLLRRQVLLFAVLVAGWAVAAWILTELTRNFYDFVVGPRLFGELPDRVFSWKACRLSFTWFALVSTAGGACAIKVAHGWYEQRQLQLLLLQRKLRTELQLLKAQLQPTFLFDTLSTLRTLTARSAPEAPAAVLHLSAVLRYMLYESRQEAVLLADEVELLQHYVALEKLRLGSRVDVSFSSSGSLAAHTIAPLLLLPFVENAFRHGTEPRLECAWISIDLVAKPHALVVKIINGRADSATARQEAAGLGQIRQRLGCLYPGRHSLKILSDTDSYFVLLRLRLAPAAGLAPAAAEASVALPARASQPVVSAA